MKVLIASVNKSELEGLIESLGDRFETAYAEDESSCYEKFCKERFDFTFIDVDLLEKNHDTYDLKSQLVKYWKVFPKANIVVLARAEKTRVAVNAVKLGACDYLNYPIEKSELDLVMVTVNEISRSNAELEFLRDRFWDIKEVDAMKTCSPKMTKVNNLIKSVAPTNSTILLSGETGVGKSMIAKIIHNHSSRKNGPFIPVHCGALNDNLIESELFGHEKGAFTGAFQRKLGKFELAHRGTIFLDEIGTISLNMQIKLLQVLQESCFQRVGGQVNVNVDVRVIAATNENLKDMVEKKLFRQDLYHRINLFPIELPPIRERKEDLFYILNVFLKKLNKNSLKNIKGIRADAFEAMSNYQWTGNIREIENVMERAFILEESDLITPSSLPFEIVNNACMVKIPSEDKRKSLAEFRQEVIERFEKQYLEGLLVETFGHVKTVSEIAGLCPRQINKMINKYNIDRSLFYRKDSTH
ncbi:MAG: sigma-54-dependent Fis family transcriptional regulator [Bdellovibrionales bacterium]|nr:sigma-54-dependent Fis family transcriptional regulator [Bdellovibrionales bacterium]